MSDFLEKKSNLNYEFLNAQECLNILTDDEKQELVNNKTDIVFEAGETIVKRGALAHNILYITNGLVKLEIINDSKPFTIGMTQSHSFIGIVCCFAFKYFDFKATALEKTEVSIIDMDIIEKFIKNNGDFALNLIKHMSGVANAVFHKVTSLSQKNIEGALAIILLDFKNIYNSNSFVLPVNRIELSNMIGYSKESVINTLSKYNREGIISVDDRKIEILNSKKLKQISIFG